MWFKLKLNAFLPPLSILVGHNGVLYVKLIGIGALLQKTNPYEYRTRMIPLCVQAHQVLSAAAFDYPPHVLRMHVVPVTLACSLIAQENAALGQLFLSRLTQGWAHKEGVRKFELTESKAPMLVCVDKRDEKCVSVSLWIQEFIRELEVYREEVGRRVQPSTSGDAGSSGNEPLAKRPRLDFEETGSETFSSEEGHVSGLERVTIKTETNDSPESSSDTLPNRGDISVESEVIQENVHVKSEAIQEDIHDTPQEDIPVESDTVQADMQVELNAIREDIPVELHSNREDIPVESDTIQDDMQVELNAIQDDMQVELNAIREDIPTTREADSESHHEETTRPSTPTRVLETGGDMQDRPEVSKMMFIRLNPAFFTTLQSPEQFPEPGDVIVKLNALPSRVWFIRGEEEGLLWLTTKRPE